MGIFSKLFVAVMAQMIIENAEKNRVTYYLFSIKNRGYTLVIFFMGQSLLSKVPIIIEIFLSFVILKSLSHTISIQIYLCLNLTFKGLATISKK